MPPTCNNSDSTLPICSGAFQKSILRGEKAAIYPVLSFVLSKLPALKKRAYVARYLLPVDVPPEFLANEALAETLSQYRALQAEFKDTHKACCVQPIQRGCPCAAEVARTTRCACWSAHWLCVAVMPRQCV
jgi:hypothetical protein